MVDDAPDPGDAWPDAPRDLVADVAPPPDTVPADLTPPPDTAPADVTPPPDTAPPADLTPPPPDQSTPDQKWILDGPGPLNKSTSPLIASSTGGYGVVWLEELSGASTPMFRMLSGTGVPQSSAVSIAPGPVQALTSMIWNGADFVVFFSDSSGLNRARILESGLNAAGIKSFTTTPVSWAQVVQAGNTYGLVYKSANQVLLQRLDGNANQKGSATVVYTAPSTGYTGIGSYRSPAQAYGDGYHGVAFTLESASTAAAQGPLYFARLDSSGALVGAAQQIAAGPVLYPSVGHGSGYFTVTWHASGGPALLRINATTGAVVGSATLLGGDSCCDHAPLVDAGSAGLVEVWTSNAGSYSASMVRVNPSSGAKLFGPQVLLTRQGLRHPWIAPRGGEYGLVWFDTNLGGPEVFFTRLNANATPTGAILRVSP